MQILIAEYLHNFKILYPRASFIPKMHYMLHLPSQMREFGPLRHHWCMRFEGKNGFFAGKKVQKFHQPAIVSGQTPSAVYGIRLFIYLFNYLHAC